MQPVEALTRVIALADKELGRVDSILGPVDAEEINEEDYPDQVAVAICNTMLNTALPVARFRAHVTVEDCKTGSRVGLGDFTISATSIDAIKNGMVGLTMEKVTVYASLWEQRATGADMLSGYQGETKTLGFRNWLREIDQYNAAPTVN